MQLVLLGIDANTSGLDGIYCQGSSPYSVEPPLIFSLYNRVDREVDGLFAFTRVISVPRGRAGTGCVYQLGLLL